MSTPNCVPTVLALFIAASILLAPSALLAQNAGKKKDAPKGGAPAGPGEKGEDPQGKGGTPEGANPAPGPGGEKLAKPKQPLTIDEQYVQDNLDSYLHATKTEFLEDGRVKLLFDFTQKKEDHEAIFTPRISNETKDRFRWTMRGEYGWSWAYGGGSTSAEDSSIYYNGGLRIAMDGSAHLNVWFTDDVEAEIHYLHSVSSSDKQMASLVFTSESGKSLGSNFGSQCMTFTKGRVQGARGTVGAISTDKAFKNKLIVRDGIFEAHRDGRQKQKMEYVKKGFASGKLGFIWGGGIASFIGKLEVTGRIDSKKMAAMLRKVKR